MLSARSDSLLFLLAEFSKYHCAELYDRPAGGKEDVRLCAAWYQTPVQGANSYSALIDSSSRVRRVEWGARSWILLIRSVSILLVACPRH